MDRFIVEPFCQTFALNVYLKSNMDRFIVYQYTPIFKFAFYLKSNMDRFIAVIIYEEVLRIII